LLLFIDFTTGVIKGAITKQLSSRRAVGGFFSKFTILLLILSLGVFGKLNNYDMENILSGTFFALSLAEMYSIVGNTYEIRTGKKVKEYDAVAIILSKMLGVIKTRLDRIEINQNTDGNSKK
jgi:phage-related holin